MINECKILKLSRNDTKHIQFLLENRGKLLDENISLAGLKKMLAQQHFQDLFEMQKAIQKATIGGRKSISSLIKLNRRIRLLGDIELQPRPLLNGHELLQLGADSGPSLGKLADELYIAQLEGDVKNKEQAIEWVNLWFTRQKNIT